MHQERSEHLRSDLIFYLACFVFLYVHLFYFPATPFFNEADHLNLLNDAKRMTEGEFIYRDFFEFLFPGAPALYALLMTVFGPKYWIVNAVIVVHGLAAALLGVQISRKVIADSAVAYLPSAIFLFFGFRWFGGDGEHRMLSPLLAYLAVLLLLNGRTLRRLALTGAACAFASFFTQQRGFLTLAAILLFLFFEFGWLRRDWQLLVKSSLVLLGSFVGVLAVAILPFVIVAGPDTFFDCTFVFLRTYVQDSEFNSLQAYFSTLAKIQTLGTPIFLVSLFYTILIPAIYLAVFAFAANRWKRSNTSGLSGILLLSIVGLFLSIGTSGPNVSRLFQVALPATIALVWLVYQTQLLTASFARVAVVVLAAVGILLGIRLHFAPESKMLDTPSGRIVFLSPLVAERYEWLLKNAEPGDLVYETYNSHVNFPLALRNPSRISILLNSGYSPPEHVRWVIEDLKRAGPRYIIWNGTWTNDVSQRPEGERLEPFYRFMTSNYRRVKTFTPYEDRAREIWERADLSGLR